MRRLALVLVAGGTALVSVHGCGIDVVGVGVDTPDLQNSDALAPSEGGAPDASITPADGSVVTEAGVDASHDAAGDAAPSCTCAVVAPAGWARVAYAANRNTECAGDLVKDDRVANPTTLPGSCTCDCQVTQKPDCNQGNFDSLADSTTTAQCNSNTGVSRPANNGACTKASNNLASHRKAIPPAPVGGTCAGAGTAHPDQMTTDAVRVCAEAGQTCACDAGASFTTCIRATGDLTCPTGFSKRTLVGAKGAVLCAATCGCSLTGTTCSGTISYYSDQSCATLIEEIDDKTCQAEKGTSFNSYKWTGTPNVVCTPGAAPTGTASLDAVETVCCP